MTDRKAEPEILPPRRPLWRHPAMIVGVVILGLSGAAAGAAYSQAGHFGPGMWRHGPMGGGAMDPAHINRMIERGIKHLAIEIDATADQQARLIVIAQSAANDLLPLRDKLQAARQQGRALLLQPNLDRGAIETFRAEQMALADQASRRIAQAVGETAEVLTAEQRLRIGSRLEAMRGGFPGGFRPGWHRG